MDRREKCFLSLLFLIPTVIGILMRLKTTIWPLFNIGFAVFGVVLFAAIVLTRHPWRIALTGLLGGGVLLSHGVLIFPTLLGRDPPWFFLSAQKVIETGSVGAVSVGFYEHIPGYIVYITELSQLLGGPRSALIGFVAVACITFPVSVGYFAWTIVESRRAAALGMAFAIVSQTALDLAFYPIAQVLHAATICIVGGIFLQFNRESRSQYRYVMLFILLLWLLSHKLPLLMFVGGSLGVLSASAISSRIFSESVENTTRFVGWTGVLGMALFVSQQTILSPYLANQFIVLFTPLREFGFVTSLAGGPPNIGIYSQLFLVSNERMVLAASIASLFALFVLHRNQQSWEAIGYIGGSVLVGVVAILAWVSANRIVLSLFPPLMAAMGAGSIIISDRANAGGKRVIALFVVLLIMSQAFAPGPVPDDPRTPQLYLNNEEVESKQWAATYATPPIFGDSHYVLAKSPERLDAVAQIGRSSILSSTRGQFQYPQSEADLRSHTVVTRNINFYFIEWLYEFRQDNPEFETTRNSIYTSGNVTITNPSINSLS
jgi:hypothetical protein